MSYAIAPTFEGNRMGIRRLSALSGIGGVPQGLGDVQTVASNLVSMGWNASLVNGLIQAGATEQQLYDLQDGLTDPTTLLMQLKAAQSIGIDPGMSAPPPPSASVPPRPSVPGQIPYSMTPAQVPQGSTLLYQVSYAQTLLTLANLTLPASNVAAQIASQLPQYGMAVLQSTITDNGPQTFGITFSIRVTGNGFAQVNDAYLILHSLMQRIVGNTITSDPLSIVATGPGQGLPAGLPPGATSWMSNNWPLLVAGGFAFLLVGMITEKRV
jgi:hypothetical protein